MAMDSKTRRLSLESEVVEEKRRKNKKTDSEEEEEEEIEVDVVVDHVNKPDQEQQQLLQQQQQQQQQQVDEADDFDFESAMRSEQEFEEDRDDLSSNDENYAYNEYPDECDYDYDETDFYRDYGDEEDHRISRMFRSKMKKSSIDDDHYSDLDSSDLDY